MELLCSSTPGKGVLGRWRRSTALIHPTMIGQAALQDFGGLEGWIS
jgi:hypothetical protein